MKPKLCLPLDGLQTIDEVRSRVEELGPHVDMFKIGKELFTRFGPEVVKIVKKHGEVFLDLKFHDIPNTVRGAVRSAVALDVDMINVHSSGGLEMMKAAVEALIESKNSVKIIGVTVLTSINKEIMNNELKINGDVEDQVFHLAKLCEKAGMNGIVCSAADLEKIKKEFPKDFLFVTPGIKGPNTDAGKDQKRVVTPGLAVKLGANILVVGRAITACKTKEERIKAAKEVREDMLKFE